MVGVILHVLWRARNGDATAATLPEVDRILADPTRPITELWNEMIEYGHVRGDVHPVVGAVGRDMIDRPEKEAGSVLSTAKSYLSLYRDPVVGRNVSRSDFRVKDLMNHSTPVSLYIITQPTDKDRLRPLVRVLINMIIRLSADKMDFEKGRPKARYKHRMLLMMDEFPSLGKLDIMQESLAFVAGYGIKCYLVIQDLSQLHAAYGKEESLTSNCHIQNAFPPNRLETADHLSKLTGTTTIVKEQATTSGKRLGMWLGQVSTTFQEVQRPLLTTDEALRMPGPKKDSDGGIKEPGDMVVYVAGFPGDLRQAAALLPGPGFPKARRGSSTQAERPHRPRPDPDGQGNRFAMSTTQNLVGLAVFILAGGGLRLYLERRSSRRFPVESRFEIARVERVGSPARSGRHGSPRRRPVRWLRVSQIPRRASSRSRIITAHLPHRRWGLSSCKPDESFASSSSWRLAVPSAIQSALLAGGIVINDTPSLPEGFYRKKNKRQGRGISCFSGCRSGELSTRPYAHENLIKQVVAVEGDKISIVTAGV